MCGNRHGLAENNQGNNSSQSILQILSFQSFLQILSFLLMVYRIVSAPNCRYYIVIFFCYYLAFIIITTKQNMMDEVEETAMSLNDIRDQDRPGVTQNDISQNDIRQEGEQEIESSNAEEEFFMEDQEIAPSNADALVSNNGNGYIEWERTSLMEFTYI